ncbi:Receptor-like protein kinase HSL1 [Hordeum vulgare]|nr:Receptor-like protein kinase HSL1 [Hordeum vulgare]
MSLECSVVALVMPMGVIELNVSKGKEEQMKIYLEFQRKKLVMDEAAGRRKLGMEEATKRRKLDIEGGDQLKRLEIEATMADTKAKEVALAFMSVDKNNMSPERNAWFANRQKEMFARDGPN